MVGRIAICALTFGLMVGCAATSPQPEPDTRRPQPAASQASQPDQNKTARIAKSEPRKTPPEATDKQKTTTTRAKTAAPKKPSPWQQALNEHARPDDLRVDAHYFPRLSWLSARWCRKGDASGIPALYYNVLRTPTGFLNLAYGDPRGSDKYYHHVHVSGRYFDLWDGFAFGKYLKNQGGRRLEKRSDNEFALVYLFEERPQRDRYDKQVLIDYATRRAAEVKPRDHIESPEVFVKCR